MKITIFTSNQRRHLGLVRTLAPLADTLYVVQETKTHFPGTRAAVHPQSALMEAYFARMLAAEHTVFGDVGFLPDNARAMALFMGDLSHLPLDILAPALESDLYVVFGASWIRGPLVDHLMDHRTVNIHMGLSPYYRGSACNFWALYDDHPEMVGSTLHLLSRGLDSGPILCHAMPKPAAVDGFVLGMQAVSAAHQALARLVGDGSVFSLAAEPQDKSLELRYSRGRDFTDEVVEKYLPREMPAQEIEAKLRERGPGLKLKNPIYV